MSEQSKSVADRAMALHEAKSPHQLAVEFVCMQDQRDQLAEQLMVMTESLREAVSVISSINHGGEHEVHVEGDEPAFWQRGEWVEWAKRDVLPKLKSALAGKLPEQDDFLRDKRTDYFPEGISLTGKLPERQDTEWTDAIQATTEQDYRELQAQHDQLQSRLKAALDALGSAVKCAAFEGHAHRPWHDAAKALLPSGQVPEHPVYYMRDNHTFKRLSDDVDTAIKEIEAELDAGWTSGMLCSKRYGFPSVHSDYSKPRDQFLSLCRNVLLAAAPKPEGAA